MEPNASSTGNLKQVIAFLHVTDMERSLCFYLDGLGFAVKNKWEPAGKIRWCWLTRGGASLMLQEYLPGRRPEGVLGNGVTLSFQCEDAVSLYREFRSRGLDAKVRRQFDVGHRAHRPRQLQTRLREPDRCARGNEAIGI